jgi:pyroglutamyl-peptidase
MSQPIRDFLLTGFEPFGGNVVNPSGLVAAALDGYRPPGAQVRGGRLPVSWTATGPQLDTLLAVQPTWVLLLGLAARATTIRIELQAANIAGPILDNAQALPAQPYLVLDGDATRASTFPGARLVARLQAAGLPAELSTDAGQYLCNFALYHALAWGARQPQPPVTGFVHLPPLAAPDAPGLTLDDEIRAVRLLIDTLVQETREA